jgi:hypothetical protein
VDAAIIKQSSICESYLYIFIIIVFYNLCGYHSFRSACFCSLTIPNIFVLHSEFLGIKVNLV